VLGLESKEKFLTLDIGAERTAGLYFHVGADRRLVVEKLEEDIDLEKFLRSPWRRAAQASWEGEHFFDHRRRILAVADSRRVTTIPVPLAWHRELERRRTPLTPNELDDHIGQVFPKIVAECHTEAARRFGVESVEAVLVGARANDVAVDGRKMPHGENVLGGEVSLVLELTFAARSLFDRLKPLFSSPEPFFFAESAQARLAALSSVRPLPLNLIVADNSSASLFVFQKAKEKFPVLYREPFAWPFKRMIEEISAAFSVSRAVAGDMERVCAAGDVSPSVRYALGGFAAPAEEAFAKALRKAKVRGTVLVDVPEPLSYSLPHHEGKSIIEDVPLNEILAKFDLSLDAGPLRGESAVLWRHIAPFLLMYFDHAQGALNDSLRKRVHWLAG
jgi:hypothetical protein